MHCNKNNVCLVLRHQSNLYYRLKHWCRWISNYCYLYCYDRSCAWRQRENIFVGNTLSMRWSTNASSSNTSTAEFLTRSNEVRRCRLEMRTTEARCLWLYTFHFTIRCSCWWPLSKFYGFLTGRKEQIFISWTRAGIRIQHEFPCPFGIGLSTNWN